MPNPRDGRDGRDGLDGENGRHGKDGRSAYEVALSRGFKGDAEQWLGSLVGPKGRQGERGKDGINGKDGMSPSVRKMPSRWSFEIVRDDADRIASVLTDGWRFDVLRDDFGQIAEVLASAS